MSQPASPSRPQNKAQRARSRLFPDATVYEPIPGTYSAIPWVFRRALAAIPPRTFQVLVYLYLRSGPESVTWFTDRQIASDLGIGYRKLTPHLRWLTDNGFLAAASHAGDRFIALLSPEQALRDLATAKKLSPDVMEAVAEDFETIGLAPLEPVAQDPP